MTLESFPQENISTKNLELSPEEGEMNRVKDAMVSAERFSLQSLRDKIENSGLGTAVRGALAGMTIFAASASYANEQDQADNTQQYEMSAPLDASAEGISIDLENETVVLGENTSEEQLRDLGDRIRNVFGSGMESFEERLDKFGENMDDATEEVFEKENPSIEKETDIKVTEDGFKYSHTERYGMITEETRVVLAEKIGREPTDAEARMYQQFSQMAEMGLPDAAEFVAEIVEKMKAGEISHEETIRMSLDQLLGK